MTTTELIALLEEIEFGASGRPREISFEIKDAFMAEPKITVRSTGDGICGPEITLYLEPKRIYMKNLESCPYCGGGAELKQWNLPGRSTPLHYVVCTDCGAMTWPYIADPSAAAERWNTRKEKERW